VPTRFLPTNPAIAERVDRLDLPFSAHGIDPYGIDKRELGRFFTWMGWFYRRYFHAEVYGIEHVPAKGSAMLVSNHQGGIAIDAGMVLASVFFECEPPRLAQGMVEKFLASLPGSSHFTAKVGQVTGLPQHAERLLQDGRLLMVFPEGARGTAKLHHQSDSLVRFGTGFMRLALQTGSPIVPLAVIGAGDAFPTVANLYKLGKLVGAPYIPIPRYLLPIPRPTTFQILYSAPMRFEGDGTESDDLVAGYVEQVRLRIHWLIEQGRKLREGKLDPNDLEVT